MFKITLKKCILNKVLKVFNFFWKSKIFLREEMRKSEMGTLVLCISRWMLSVEYEQPIRSQGILNQPMKEQRNSGYPKSSDKADFA